MKARAATNDAKTIITRRLSTGTVFAGDFGPAVLPMVRQIPTVKFYYRTKTPEILNFVATVRSRSFLQTLFPSGPGTSRGCPLPPVTFSALANILFPVSCLSLALRASPFVP